MTVIMFFACFLIIFSYPLVLWLGFVTRDHIRIVIAVFSSFGWVVSCLFSGVVWYAVEPLRKDLLFGAIFSVLFQEGMRLGMYCVLTVAEGGLSKLRNNSEKGNSKSNKSSPDKCTPPGAGKKDAPSNPSTYNLLERRNVAIVSGAGFGAMSGAMNGCSILKVAIARGAIGLPQHFKLEDAGFGDPYFTLISSVQIGIMCILHIIWHVNLWYALDNRHNNDSFWMFRLSFILSTHILYVVLTSQLNSTGQSYLCIGLCAFILLVVVFENYYFQVLAPKRKMNKKVVPNQEACGSTEP